MENEPGGLCRSPGVLGGAYGAGGFSQSLCTIRIILIVFLSSFFIRVTFTYRKSFLQRNAEEKNPSALPNSLALAITNTDLSSARSPP